MAGTQYHATHATNRALIAGTEEISFNRAQNLLNIQHLLL